jgi:hypothetical protein
MNNSNPSQAELIRQHLEAGKTITALEALYEFGCARLSARIHELIHRANLPIDSELVFENGKHYSRYFIRKNAQPCG